MVESCGIECDERLKRYNFADALSELNKSQSNSTLKQVLQSVAYQPDITVAPVMVYSMAEVTAAINATAVVIANAVSAVVTPAVTAGVTAAVTPAVTAGVIAAIRPCFRNIRIANSNHGAFSSGNAGATLVPLLKETGGFGAPLPGAAAPAGGILPVAPIAIGAVVPGFPATVAAAQALTGPQLNVLSMLYNDNFAIVAGDTVVVRRRKFQHWAEGFV